MATPRKACMYVSIHTSTDSHVRGILLYIYILRGCLLEVATLDIKNSKPVRTVVNHYDMGKKARTLAEARLARSPSSSALERSRFLDATHPFPISRYIALGTGNGCVVGENPDDCAPSLHHMYLGEDARLHGRTTTATRNHEYPPPPSRLPGGFLCRKRSPPTLDASQAMGKFSHEEVACVMERRFFDDPRNARARAGAAYQNSSEKFMVVAGECGAPGAVWWTRRGVNVRGRGRGHGRGGVACRPPFARVLVCVVLQ